MSVLAHTYSITARDPDTGEIGVAVHSHAFAVGAIVPWAEAGVGVVATQAFANVDHGPRGLALMRTGASAADALAALLREDEGREMRQLALVDAQGNVAVHTGSRCIPAAGHLCGAGFSVQANLVESDAVWRAMGEAYARAGGDLPARLLAALQAAQAAGGDIRGQQAAALLVVAGARPRWPWQGRLFDLRVDDHPRPLDEIARLVAIRRAWLLFERSAELARSQRLDEAVGTLERAIALAPRLAELRFRGTEILFQAGRVEQALATLRTVIAEDPAWAKVVSRLAAIGMLPDDPALRGPILGRR